MKVLCISNSRTAVPENYLDIHTGTASTSEVPITVGKEYVVYGLALQKNAQVWYYISDDDGLYYPFHYPAPMFQVVDGRPSKYWRFAFTPEHLDHIALFGFEEWVRDEYFYDRLTNGEESEVSTFRTMKQLMDSEDVQSDR